MGRSVYVATVEGFTGKSAVALGVLRKPVNDLSRGATVRDIVNTVAITAIQA
jgi:phosphotransacetylase